MAKTIKDGEIDLKVPVSLDIIQHGSVFMGTVKKIFRMVTRWARPSYEIIGSFVIKETESFFENHVGTVTSGTVAETLEPYIRHRVLNDYVPDKTPEEYEAYLRNKLQTEYCPGLRDTFNS